MSDNTLSVKITADVVDLQTKFSIARAEVNSLTSEMNKLARQSAAGIIDPAGSARLQQVAGDMLHARTEAAGYAAELQKAGVAVGGFAGRMESAHGSIATATREFRALFDELSSGRTRMTPGTLAIIASRVFGLGPAALGSVAGVGLLAAGLGYLGFRALETSKALDSMKLGAEFAGNFDTTRADVAQFTKELEQASNVTHKQALAIMDDFARIPEATTPEIHALTALVSDYARLTEQDSDKAGEALAKLFNPKTSAAELAHAIGGVTAAQIQMAQAADRSGNASEIVAAKLALVSSETERSRATIVTNIAALSNWRNWWDVVRNAVIDNYSAEMTHTRLVEAATKAEEANAAAIRQRAEAAARIPPTPEQTLKVGVQTAEDVNPVVSQVQKANAEIARMSEALVVAQHEGDQVNVNLLNASLAETRERLSALQFGPVVEKMRSDMAALAAAWDGTQSGLLAEQIQIAARALGETRQGSKEYLAIKSEEAKLSVNMNRAAGEEIIANAKQQIAAIQGTELQRLDGARAVLQHLVDAEKLTSNQRQDIARELVQTVTAEEDKRLAQSQAIERQDAATEIAISRMTLEAKKAALDAEVTATQAAADRKLGIEKQLAAQLYALDLQGLQSERDSLQDQPVEQNRVDDEIRQLQAKLQLDLANLDRQGAAERARLAQQQVTQWQKAVGEIENAESTLVSDLLNKRKTLSQSLLQIGGNLVTQEIQNDVKGITTRLAMATSEQAQEKSLEQGGFLYHVLFAGQGLQTTMKTQAAQTQAVVAGASAREAAQSAAAAQGQAQQGAIAARSIMSDAARAFSGTYASLSQIPVVGPVLAPVGAAAAFAAVAGYESLASLDVGAWNLPRDTVAQLHAGESVVPKDFAQGLRENGGFGAGGGGGDTHYHHYDIAAMDAASFASVISRTSNRDALLGLIKNHVGRGR